MPAGRLNVFGLYAHFALDKTAYTWKMQDLSTGMLDTGRSLPNRATPEIGCLLVDAILPDRS